MEAIVLSLIVLFLIFDKRKDIHHQYIRFKYKIKIPIEGLYQNLGKLSAFSKFTNYDYSSSYGFTFTGSYTSGLNISGSITSNPLTGAMVVYNGNSWQPVSITANNSYTTNEFDILKQDNAKLKTELADLKSKLNKYFGGII